MGRTSSLNKVMCVDSGKAARMEEASRRHGRPITKQAYVLQVGHAVAKQKL